MNTNVLDQPLLEKNVEQIKLYANEEQSILTIINNTMLSITDSYKSSNSNQIQTNITNFTPNITKIYHKRTTYTNTLTNVIAQYNQISIQANQVFNKDV